MHDTADDAAIIDPELAARVRRQIRIKPRKLVNHDGKPLGIPYMGPSPNLITFNSLCLRLEIHLNCAR